MLNIAKEKGYDFIEYADANLYDNDINDSPTEHVHNNRKGKILLRHDIDVDLSAAVKMANEEFNSGIKSTYFLMLRSPCYNLMSRSSHNYVNEILQLNHNIGLHYDHGHDLENKNDFSYTHKQIELQSKWLESLFSCKISAVSFHQPNIKAVQDLNNFGCLLNTYSKSLREKYQYISDSNRKFSLFDSDKYTEKSICRLNKLANYYPKNIQLLIHPLWWIYEESSTEKVWDQALIKNFEISQKQLLKTERAYGPTRSFKISTHKNNYK